MTTAWVLSGGGNHGPLEVGAMQALFANGIRPDILIGTSVGALNAAFIAMNPTFAGAVKLGEVWKSATKDDLLPGNWLTQAWRFITQKDSLVDNSRLIQFIVSHTPPNVKTFADIQDVRLYLIAGDLQSASLYLWGDDPTARLLDAVLSSSAEPGMLPPINIDGYELVDGATVDNLGLQVALAKGATEIYALDLTTTGRNGRPVRRAFNIVMRAISVLGYQQFLSDLYRIDQTPGVTLHYILLDAFRDLPSDDFSHSAEMIDVGCQIAQDYLNNPQPLNRVRAGIAAPTAPPGATLIHRLR